MRVLVRPQRNFCATLGQDDRRRMRETLMRSLEEDRERGWVKYIPAGRRWTEDFTPFSHECVGEECFISLSSVASGFRGQIEYVYHTHPRSKRRLPARYLAPHDMDPIYGEPANCLGFVDERGRPHARCAYTPDELSVAAAEEELEGVETESALMGQLKRFARDIGVCVINL